MYYLSKQQKADIAFRIKVAEKFGIQPLSLRASKLLDKYCPSVEEAKEWASNKSLLKIRQMGKKTIIEIRYALGVPDEYGRTEDQIRWILGLNKAR